MANKQTIINIKNDHIKPRLCCCCIGMVLILCAIVMLIVYDKLSLILIASILLLIGISLTMCIFFVKSNWELVFDDTKQMIFIRNYGPCHCNHRYQSVTNLGEYTAFDKMTMAVGKITAYTDEYELGIKFYNRNHIKLHRVSTSNKQKFQHHKQKVNEINNYIQQIRKIKYENDGLITVYGYMRNLSKLLMANNIFYENVPEPIYQLIWRYYGMIECFYKYDSSQIQITDKNKTIVKTGNDGWNNTVYANSWISSDCHSIITWKLYVNRHGHKDGIIIGISSDDTGSNKVVHCNDIRECIVYGFENKNRLIYLNRGDSILGDGCIFGEDDIISLILDLKQRILSYNLNGNMTKVLFMNIKTSPTIQYVCAVSLFWKDTSISLIHFNSK